MSLGKAAYGTFQNVFLTENEALKVNGDLFRLINRGASRWNFS